MTQFNVNSTRTSRLRALDCRMACLLLGMTLLLVGTGHAEVQRLAGTVVPQNYQLKFAPDLAKDSFAGEETIDVQVLHPATSIVLNAAEIDFQKTEIISGGETQRAQVTLDPKN